MSQSQDDNEEIILQQDEGKLVEAGYMLREARRVLCQEGLGAEIQFDSITKSLNNVCFYVIVPDIEGQNHIWGKNYYIRYNFKRGDWGVYNYWKKTEVLTKNKTLEEIKAYFIELRDNGRH